MSTHPWNETYASGFIPWDTGQPEPELLQLIQAGELRPGKTLEIGCGTGTNAIWLAEHGFEVLAIDLAPLAIQRAREKDSGHAVRFEVMDILDRVPASGPFELVFDRGVFHTFDDAEARSRFAAQVSSVLKPGGDWVSLIGSTEGAPREVGPYRYQAGRRLTVKASSPRRRRMEPWSAC